MDRASGFKTRSILCLPIEDRRGSVFAVAQLLNKRSGEPFSAADEQEFRGFTEGVAPILEAFTRMAQRAGGASA